MKILMIGIIKQGTVVTIAKSMVTFLKNKLEKFSKATTIDGSMGLYALFV